MTQTLKHCLRGFQIDDLTVKPSVSSQAVGELMSYSVFLTAR